MLLGARIPTFDACAFACEIFFCEQQKRGVSRSKGRTRTGYPEQWAGSMQTRSRVVMRRPLLLTKSVEKGGRSLAQ